MKISKLSSLFFAVLLGILYACQEKDPLTENPIVITGSTITSEENIVTFTGSLLSLGNAIPVNYGFVWSNKNVSPSIADYKFRFNEKPQKGNFNAEIDYDLFEDTVSYVRAFVQTRDAVIYGEVSSFYSKSSSLPRIISVSPDETSGNDTITITGEHLTSNISEVSIQYQGDLPYGTWRNTKIVYADGKSIRFILSETPLTASADLYLSVKIRGKDIQSEGTIAPKIYVNVGPQISGFYPREVSKDGTVKIGIKNMQGILNRAYLYSKEFVYSTEISAIEGDSIKINLDNLRYAKYRIKLVTTFNGLSYSCYSKDSIEVKRPEITGIVENSLSAGDSITVIGKYLNSDCFFYVENEECPVHTYAKFKLVNQNKIRMALPETIFDGANYLCINTYDGFVSKIPVQAKSRWTIKNKLPGANRYSTCLQSGDRFIFGNWSGNYSNEKDIYIYNIKSNSLQKIDQSSNYTIYQAVLAKEDDIYLFRAYYPSPSDVPSDSYSINLKTGERETQESVKLTSAYSFVDQIRICSFNDKFYLKANSSNRVYQYDLANKTWSFLNTIPVVGADRTYLLENSSELYFYYVAHFDSNKRQSVVSSYTYDKDRNLWKQEPNFGNIPDEINFMFIDNDNYWFCSSSKIYKYSTDGELVKSYVEAYPVTQLYDGKFYGLLPCSDSFSYIVEFDPNKY